MPHVLPFLVKTLSSTQRRVEVLCRRMKALSLGLSTLLSTRGHEPW